MKKIKTLNKLLSSLTLLSPLAGIGFNNQYQNSQKVITENNSVLNNYFNSVGDQRPMGDITVNVEGTTITGYVSGTGDLVVDSDITEIAASAFKSNSNINGLDLSNATSLTTIGGNAFYQCSNLSGDLVIPPSLTSIGYYAFIKTNFLSITVDPINTAYSLATNLGPNVQVLMSGTDGIWKNESEAIGCLCLGDIIIPNTITSIKQDSFSYTNIASLDLSQATSLTTIGTNAFYSCSNLSADIVIPSSVTSIGNYAFSQTGISSLDLSQATSLTSIENNAFQSCSNLTGNLVIPSSVTIIGEQAFKGTKILSLDLSQATSLTTIGEDAFTSCKKLTGDLVIPSSVTSIGNYAFSQTGISSLDLSNATSLTTIGTRAFQQLDLSGDLVIPSNVATINDYAFYTTYINNLYFLSETPPTSFGSNWQPTITGKVYVPSEAAKEAYLRASNFGFNQDQIEIGLPPEPSKSNIPLILGLLFGLGIPIILAVAFVIWHLTKKKKTTVKI